MRLQLTSRPPIVALPSLAVLLSCGGGEGGRISGPAGSLAVDDGGSGGVPVVFVHSLAGNTGQWRAQLDHLRPRRRAIALDLRGHGASDPPRDGDYTLHAMAGDVAAVVDTLGLARFVLVGHSFGGDVAMTYAARHPDRIAGLLLVDPDGDPSGIPAAAWDGLIGALESDAYRRTIEAHWATINQNADSAVRERVLADLRATPPEAVVAAFKSMRRFDPRAALQAYRGPATSVVSDLNNAPFSLHNVIPELETVRVHGTGHWLQMDKPDEFNRLLDTFLADVVPVGR